MTETDKRLEIRKSYYSGLNNVFGRTFAIIGIAGALAIFGVSQRTKHINGIYNSDVMQRYTKISESLNYLKSQKKTENLPYISDGAKLYVDFMREKEAPGLLEQAIDSTQKDLMRLENSSEYKSKTTEIGRNHDVQGGYLSGFLIASVGAIYSLFLSSKRLKRKREAEIQELEKTA